MDWSPGVLLQRLAQKLFGEEIRLEAHHYNNWKQRELRERAAWVTDLNFEARLDKPDWVVIDHHATEAPAKNAMLIHDLNKSAGLLCYELCKRARAGFAGAGPAGAFEQRGGFVSGGRPGFRSWRAITRTW